MWEAASATLKAQSSYWVISNYPTGHWWNWIHALPLEAIFAEWIRVRSLSHQDEWSNVNLIFQICCGFDASSAAIRHCNSSWVRVSTRIRSSTYNRCLCWDALRCFVLGVERRCHWTTICFQRISLHLLHILDNCRCITELGISCRLYCFAGFWRWW